jgi:hypothetical protein
MAFLTNLLHQVEIMMEHVHLAIYESIILLVTVKQYEVRRSAHLLFVSGRALLEHGHGWLATVPSRPHTSASVAVK